MEQCLAKYVGIPFSENDKNCWWLVRSVLEREAGIKGLDSYSDISAADIEAATAQMQTDIATETWHDVTLEPRCIFDCALLRGMPLHVGIMVSPTDLLHIWRATDSVVMPICHPRIRFRIIGFYRHKDLS